MERLPIKCIVVIHKMQDFKKLKQQAKLVAAGKLSQSEALLHSSLLGRQE